MQVHFTQYFQVICESMQHLNAESGGGLSMLCLEHRGSQRAMKKRAMQCLPVLIVLSFAVDLVALIPPAQVSGLVPRTLIEALTLLAGDVVLATCNFNMHKNVSYPKRWLSLCICFLRQRVEVYTRVHDQIKKLHKK